MANDQRPPGTAASHKGEAEDHVATSETQELSAQNVDVLFVDDPAGQLGIEDFVGLPTSVVVLVGRGSLRRHTLISALDDSADQRPDLFSPQSHAVLQGKHARDLEAREKFREHIRDALARHERQPAPPGLNKLDALRIRSPDVRRIPMPDLSLLMGVGIPDGARIEAFSHLRDRIAELSSTTEVSIRALRNPGKVLNELAETGEVARVTNNGKIVGWLIPATEADQHLDGLLKQGRLRRGTPVPIEPIDIDGLENSLSDALREARDEERT
ncbi:hypothetical protein [Streptomyces sp. NPDC058657]|uniref:hypothetical protein n=1 Tax=unclassified Streptomyces TaxID=2593676 RepID=UPI00364BB71E